MKTGREIMLALLMVACSTAQSATCRSGDAATIGGKVGYEKDKQAATQMAQKENSASDILGKCVSGVTSIQTTPQFPSLSDIFEQVKQKICKAVTDEINNIPFDPNNQISYNSASDKASATAAQAQPPASADNGPSLLSQFWSNIWK